MSIRERLSGNEAIATAMRQIDPDVFAMFPITPSTEIPQYYAGYVADGKVNTEFICVESSFNSLQCHREYLARYGSSAKAFLLQD